MNHHHLIITNFYTLHRDELLTYVSSRLGGQTALAEDLVQDVFTRLLTSDKMITEVTLPALVYTIARNLIADYYRHHAIRREFAEHFAHASAMETSFESTFYAHELYLRVEHCIDRLPENCRTVYRMHIYEGMKVSEISLRLGEGYKSVEYRLGAARKEVRRRLAAG